MPSLRHCIAVVLAAALVAVPSLNATAGLVLTEISAQAGVEVVHDSRGYVDGDQEIQNYYGPAVAWVDINYDRWLDLLVGNGSEGNFLFINNGDGTFDDQAELYEVWESRVTNGIAFADVDNDGRLDLMFGNYWSNPQFYIGGNQRMSEQGVRYGVDPLLYDASSPPPNPVIPETMGVSFGDFNQDGYVDLYVANYLKQPDMFMQSLGGQYFQRTTYVEVTEQAYGFQAVFWDFDNDTDMDIYVANDFGYNFLFENQGRDEGYAFIDKANIYKVAGGGKMEIGSMGMGVAIGDWDNDLDLDLFITNYEDNSFFENIGPAVNDVWRFTEKGEELGVDYRYSGWGACLCDLDLDGDLDLLQASGAIPSKAMPQPYDLRDKCWLNNGPPNYRFTEVSDEVGFNEDMMARGLATGDFDRDGDLDVAITNNTYYDPTPEEATEVYVGRFQLYRNDQDTDHHWVNLTLQGGGQHGGGIGCNRSAIGARAYVTAGGLTLMREIRAGSSFMSHNSLELEFGVGTAATVDEVRVRWTCGDVEYFTGVEVDRFYRLVEGESTAKPLSIGFTKFDATAMTDGIRLEWIVAPGTEVQETFISRGIEGQPETMRPVNLSVEYRDRQGVAFDRDVTNGVSYEYRLRLVGDDGIAVERMISATAGSRSELPGRPMVGQNYPNPFNPSTNIMFELPETMDVRLVLYDLQGRHVRTLIEGAVPSGSHTVEWDGRDDAGKSVASGTYAYALITARGTSSRQLTLIR